MIDPRALSTAAAIALLFSMLAPTAGLAEYRNSNGNNVGATHRPPMITYRPGPAVIAAPGAVYRASGAASTMASTALLTALIMTGIASVAPLSRARSPGPSLEVPLPRKAWAMIKARRFIRRRAITTAGRRSCRDRSRPTRSPTACKPIRPTTRSREPISATTAIRIPARRNDVHDCVASATPAKVNASAAIWPMPSGSCSASAEASTPITGTAMVPIAATDAGNRANAANQQT